MPEKGSDRIRRLGVIVGSGLVLGIALGAAFHNVAIGAVSGLILGAAVGAVFSGVR